jgi:transposase
MHLVKLACERPDRAGRSLSQWDCRELARELVLSGIVDGISAETVRRLLVHHKLRPWRHHLWMSPRVPRDAAFVATVRELCDLYTRRLAADEVVLCFDEKTQLRPQRRTAKTRPAKPGQPVLVESEYVRGGVINLFAALDTRTGHIYHQCYPRKRQLEFLAFLEHLDREVPARVRTIHVVLDNLRVHKGQLVQPWLAAHPRFVFHFTPVHCSWMNQIEQFFSILTRKRFGFSDFGSTLALKLKLDNYIRLYNRQARRFRWTARSFEKVLAKTQVAALAA